MYPVDLNQVFLDGTIGSRLGPAEGGSIGANPGEGDIGSFGDIDAEDIDELGYGLPYCLPRTVEEPRR